MYKGLKVETSTWRIEGRSGWLEPSEIVESRGIWNWWGSGMQWSLQAIWISLISCISQFCTDDMRLESRMSRIRPVSWSDHGTYWYLGTLKGSRNGWQESWVWSFHQRDDPAESSLLWELFRFNRTGCVSQTFPWKVLSRPFLALILSNPTLLPGNMWCQGLKGKGSSSPDCLLEFGLDSFSGRVGQMYGWCLGKIITGWGVVR